MIYEDKKLKKNMEWWSIKEIVWHLISQWMWFQANVIKLEELEYNKKIARKIISDRILMEITK